MMKTVLLKFGNVSRTLTLVHEPILGEDAGGEVILNEEEANELKNNPLEIELKRAPEGNKG